MSAEHLLRLAWQAERDGRAGMCDALLTLAVVESGPDDAVLAERCRKQLIARRPDHWFASFPTRGQALDHPRVAEAVARIRATYPPVRVERLLLRGEAQRGPYTGRSRSLSGLLDDMFGTLRTAAAPASAPRRDEVPALPFPGGASASERGDDPGSVLVFYLTVLLAMAILLRSVLPPAANDTKAA